MKSRSPWADNCPEAPLSGKENSIVSALDLEAFRATPLTREPFEYLIVPDFVRPEALPAINADYPVIDCPGSFPLAGLRPGPAFRALVREMRGAALREAFEDKFSIDLRRRATLLTVRGRCGTRDGNIHTDAVSKIITVLMYVNPSWEGQGGCLRLLRSPDDLDDVLAEVPPVAGTLVAFRRSDNSYHGHKPFLGPRRVIQLNWVTGSGNAFREVARHQLSAWVKRLLAPLRGREAAAAGRHEMA
jgi:SM-20-related protein